MNSPTASSPRRFRRPAVALPATVLLLLAHVASGQNTVTGSLTVDGEEIALEHAHYEEGLREMWLTLSTAPADAETVYALPQQGGAALFLALDPQTGKAATGWISRLLHSAYPANYGAELEPEAIQLEMETLDGTRAAGRAWLSETEIGEHTISFDVTFDSTYVEIDPCTDLGPVTVTGETGGPAEVFETFYAAIASCDWSTLKETLGDEMLSSWQEVENDERGLDLFVEFMVREMPRQASVVEVRRDGKERATLVVRFGADDEGQTTELVVERVSRRRWKIVESELIRL